MKIESLGHRLTEPLRRAFRRIPSSPARRNPSGRDEFRISALLLLLFTIHSSLFAQQSTSTAPLYQANAQYLQGRTWADYQATAGTGLALNLAPGISWCQGAMVTYAGGTLTMTNATTNYVYLDSASSCVPAKSTSTFPATGIPIATVATSGGAITAVTDRRVLLMVGAGGSGTPQLPTTVKYAESYSGSDFYAKANACLAAVAAAGGGTCDARGLSGAQTLSDDLAVGDGTHRIELLLPGTTITRATGKQFVYDSYASIIGMGKDWEAGAGGTVITGDDTVAAVRPAYNASGVVNAYLANFSTYSTSTVAGSVGLQIGGETPVGSGNWTDVRSSIFSNITTRQSNIGVLMDGHNGCTCYNHLYDVDGGGATYGAKIINSGSWPSGVNQNIWDGGNMGGGPAPGQVGLYDKGDANQYNHLDFENDVTASFILAGSNAVVDHPYEEGSGLPVFDTTATGNSIVWGWRHPIDNSTPGISRDPNFWWGPHFGPKSIGIENDILFGTMGGVVQTADDGINTNFMMKLAFSANWVNGYMDLLWGGAGQSVYGNYGHAGWRVSRLDALSGAAVAGRSTIASISDPSTPTLSVHGTLGSTTVSYAVVGHDRNGGVTLPSAFATITNAPNTLDSSNYVIITWPLIDGIFQWDVLKTNGSTSLATSYNPGIPIGTTTISYHDTGGATSAYSSPTRNTTGDVAVGGALSVGAPLAMAYGGTNQNSWTASRCVQVNSAGTALESAAAACGTGSGGGGRILSINLLSPTTAETNLVQEKFPAAVTLARVSCSVDSGTSVVIQFDERAEATPNTAGTNVLTGNLTCDTTNGGITTSFTNAGIAANAPLNLQIISSTGNPNAVRIHVQYTID
jgi:hypothetical protein